MNLCLSGKRVLAKPKTIKFIDPVFGPIAYTFNTTYRFNNGTSLVSFVKINENTYLSTNVFLRRFCGRYVLHVDQEPQEHVVFSGNVDFVSAHVNESLKYCEVVLS